MDLFAAIARRHSYRGAFTAQPVPSEDVRRIVEAGLRAPSGYNAQTTSFVIVDDPDLLARLSAMNPDSVAIKTAPVVLLVCMDKPDPESERIFFGLENYGAAVENMLLAVTALGYASVWIDGWLRTEGRDQAVAGLVGAPGSVEVRVILPIGVPDEPGEQRAKRPFAERAWRNRYGAN
jgi:nitroreductase